MKETLFKISWEDAKPVPKGLTMDEALDFMINSGDDFIPNIEVLDKDGNVKFVNLRIEGFDSWGCEVVSNGFDDIFYDANYHISNYISKLKSYPDPFKNMVKAYKWCEPTYGSFIVVYLFEHYTCNHPLDPEEWDYKTKYLGILGEQVKLIY